MNGSDAIWGAIIAAIVGFDVWCSDPDTPIEPVSARCRFWGRTHTFAGQVVVCALWGWLTYWFLPHINRKRPDL